MHIIPPVVGWFKANYQLRSGILMEAGRQDLAPWIKHRTQIMLHIEQNCVFSPPPNYANPLLATAFLKIHFKKKG